MKNCSTIFVLASTHLSNGDLTAAGGFLAYSGKLPSSFQIKWSHYLPWKKLAAHQAFSHPLSLKRRSGMYLQQRTWRQRLRLTSLMSPLIYRTTVFPQLHPCLRRSRRLASRGKAKAAYTCTWLLEEMWGSSRQGERSGSDLAIPRHQWVLEFVMQYWFSMYYGSRDF
jgi:hypothetical protein